MRGALLAALALAALAVAPAAGADFRVRASVDPAVAKLGQRVVVRGRVAYPRAAGRVRWLPAEPQADFGWGPPAPRLLTGLGSIDTLAVELPLQVFRIGTAQIPGLRFQDAAGEIHRLPMVELTVVSVIAAGDTNADLRPVRGPLAAPWWERVPWTWVVLALVVVAAIVTSIVILRRRRRRRAPAAAPRPSVLRDPAAEALAELEALRRRGLPALGRFDEHAFLLTLLVRRYLEAVARTTRPGDTVRELVLHLRTDGLGAGEVERLEALLRLWDLIKFARVPSSADEATAAERAIEELLRRRAAPPAPARQVA